VSRKGEGTYRGAGWKIDFKLARRAETRSPSRRFGEKDVLYTILIGRATTAEKKNVVPRRRNGKYLKSDYPAATADWGEGRRPSFQYSFVMGQRI